MHSATIRYCLYFLLLPTTILGMHVGYEWPPYADEESKVSALDFDTAFSAVLKGNAKMLEAFFYGGGNPNVALVAPDNKSCVTMLSAATQRGQALCVKTLIDHKASTEIPDQYGCTPVHWAAIHGHTMCMHFLIKANANLTKRAGFWQVTPLHLASLMGNTDIIQMLLAANVPCNIKTKHGLTAYEIALNDRVKALFAKNNAATIDELDKHNIPRPLALIICDYVNGNGLENSHPPIRPSVFDEKTSATTDRMEKKLAQEYLRMALTDGKEPTMLKRGTLKVVEEKDWEQKPPAHP